MNKDLIIKILVVSLVVSVLLSVFLYFQIGDCVANRASIGIKVDWTLIKDCTY